MESVVATNVTESLATLLNVTTTNNTSVEGKEELIALISDSPKWAIICGSIAPLVTIILRLSPIPTVIKFWRSGNVGSLPLMPYTALLTDSIFWLGFGLLAGDIRIIVTHVCGASLALSYSLIYGRVYSSTNKDTKDKKLANHAMFACSLILFAGGIMITMPRHVAREVIGFGADMGSLFMYAGPLAALKAVIKEKSAASLPAPFTLCCLMNGFCWFAYGWFVLEEILLWGPSLIGFLLASFQLFLICFYGNKVTTPKSIELHIRGSKMKKNLSDAGSEVDLEELEEGEDDLVRLLT